MDAISVLLQGFNGYTLQMELWCVYHNTHITPTNLWTWWFLFMSLSLVFITKLVLINICWTHKWINKRIKVYSSRNWIEKVIFELVQKAWGLVGKENIPWRRTLSFQCLTDSSLIVDPQNRNRTLGKVSKDMSSKSSPATILLDYQFKIFGFSTYKQP